MLRQHHKQNGLIAEQKWVILFVLHMEFSLSGLGDEAPELQLQRRCRELDISLDAFSALQYVGTRTRTPPTDFKNLLVTVKTQLRNINVRSPRRPAVVFSALKVGSITEIITYFLQVTIFEGKSVTVFEYFSGAK